MEWGEGLFQGWMEGAKPFFNVKYWAYVTLHVTLQPMVYEPFLWSQICHLIQQYHILKSTASTVRVGTVIILFKEVKLDNYALRHQRIE